MSSPARWARRWPLNPFWTNRGPFDTFAHPAKVRRTLLEFLNRRFWTQTWTRTGGALIQAGTVSSER